jgi:hypothetical protein
MSEVTENPMSADAASTAKANIDPKLLEVETEVARLRAKLHVLQHNFNEAQQHTSELVHNAALDGQTIKALLTEIKDEKSQALDEARKRLAVDPDEQSAYEHRSPNILLTLIEGVERRQHALQPGETVDWVWALEFEMPKHTDVLGSARKVEQREIHHEVWDLAVRMWANKLHLKYIITADDRSIILCVGATHSVLVEEAHRAKVPMRVSNTRGALNFHKDLMKYYARNHGGLNEWDPDKLVWIPRGASGTSAKRIVRDLDGDGDIDEEDMELARRQMTGSSESRILEFSAKGASDLHDKELMMELDYRGVKGSEGMSRAEMIEKVVAARAREKQMFDLHDEHRVFTSGLRQRLVRRRMASHGGVDLEMRLHSPSPKEAIEWMAKHTHRDAPHKIRSTKVHEMLTAVGAYRPDAETVFPCLEPGNPETCVVWKLAQQVLVDSEFVLDPAKGDHQEMSDKLAASNLDPVSYTELREAVEVLKTWIDEKSGPGRNERFTGTFKSFYALHDWNELEYLRTQWGTLKIIFRSVISGYSENGDSPLSLAHDDNIPHEHSVPWSWSWQPIHEIRDYFGEDCGMYYAWLGTYTSMLFLCMIFGLITGIAQIVQYGSVDKNPLTLGYSVYVGVWSVSFLESWKRREVEFRFLWGSEQVSDDEGLRPQFVGKLIVTEAGREKTVYASMLRRWLVLLVSAFICFICMGVTIAAAITASSVRNWPVPGSTDFCQTVPEMCCKTKAGDMYPTSTLGEAQLMCCGFTGNATHRLADLYDPRVCTDEVMDMCDFDSCPTPVGGTKEWLNPYGVPLATQDVKGWCDRDLPPPMWGAGTEMSAVDKLLNHPCGNWRQKQNQYLSSFFNLLIIQSFGQLYELLTAKLNDWENHRTYAEYQNALVIKNFVFQFVNNYFMLFYIGFVRDFLAEGKLDDVGISFGDSRAEIPHSTLPELQEQLLIVFTGKTFAKMLAHALKPFFVKWGLSLLAFYRRSRFNREEAKRLKRDPEYQPRSALEVLELGQTKTANDMSTYEQQANLMPYEGTFDDFNDRVIQFGYIVLFAPAYPLAPFLAFVNNVIEIRLGGYKMCSGYQRPRWNVRNGIGSWLGMLSVLGFAAVVTNSLMVAFVGSESASRYVDDDGKKLLYITEDGNATKCDPTSYLPPNADISDIDESTSYNPHCTVGTFSDR